jgi:hypothetical protein
MNIARLFVVIRAVIQGNGESAHESVALTNLDEAVECFENAAYVVRNVPGEGSADDLTIVTAAALFVADTPDPRDSKEYGCRWQSVSDGIEGVARLG